MKISRWMLGAFVAALTIGSGRLSAQVTTGTLTGSVTTSAGQPVDAAQIQVVSRATGFSRGVVSRNDGRYTVPGLEVGQYTVTVRRIGYSPESRTSTIGLGRTTVEDFKLSQQAAQLSAVTVEATATAAVISPSHTGAVTTFSDSAISHLPTLNRNFTYFVQLTPQVSTTGHGISAGGTNNR